MPNRSFFIFMMTVFCQLMTTPDAHAFEFEKAIPQKMSETTIFSIVQDDDGFMWFATRDGLWRFDGYETKEYRYNPGDINSIGSSYIRSLLVDNNGVLWVGTVGGGLNKYVVEYDQFERFVYDENDVHSLSHNDVLSIYQDENETIWVCTEDGINKLDQTSGKFERFYMENNPRTKQLNRAMISCLEDVEGNFWVSSYNRGLFLFDREAQTQEHYDISGYLDTNGEFSDYYLWNLYEDSKDRIWITTRGQGVVSIDFKSDSSVHFHVNGDENLELSSNIVYTVFEDERGDFWIGTDNGLNIYNPETNTIDYFYSDVDNPISISNDAVWSITQDESGVVWLGGWEGYADKWDPLSRRFTPRISKGRNTPRPIHYNCLERDDSGRCLIGTDSGFYVLPGEKPLSTESRIAIDQLGENYLPGLYVPDILCDSFGNVWVATNKGLWRFTTDPTEARLVMSGFCTGLYEDSRKTVWIGTQNGLHAYQRLTDSFEVYRSTPYVVGSLSHKNVTTIYEGKDGVLWVGTNNGLNRLNMTTNSFTVFRHNHNDASSLANGIVRQIYQDSRGVLWVGTSAGLSCAVDYSGKFRNFTIEDGLPGNSIASIFEDDSGNIWVATNEGVSKIIISDEDFNVSFDNLFTFNVTCINYGISDGLLDLNFRSGSFLQLDNGEVFLGGIYGVNSFFPDSIKVNPFKPSVVLTGLKIMNKTFEANPRSRTLKKSIQVADKIWLNYKQPVVTIEYVGLSFTNSEKNQYAYKMDGFDDEWIEAGTQRSVTYTNLKPGDYIFKVRAANSDGVWNMEGTSLNINVLPPPWRTWQAFVIYFILLTGGIIGFGRLLIKKQKTESRLKIEKMESDKIREMDYFKNIFFTNISHEFRTPLTLMIAPLKEISVMPELSFTLKKQIDLIYRNALRLSRLINQLLDISKIEAGHISLKVSRADIVRFARSIFEAFSFKADNSGILYQFHCSFDSALVYYDSDKIEKIMYNLLSNAFKNTPSGGKIDVYLILHSQQKGIQEVELIVQDNGVGISFENQKKIFDRYYAFNKDKVIDPSTGIGLSLSNQLAHVHKGSIGLESRPGEGSKFSLRIPVSAEVYPAENRVDSAEFVSIDKENFIQEDVMNSDNCSTDEKDVNHEALVLLIEDNDDVRNYIAESLSLNYDLLTAVDGEQGFAKAVERLPDVIVSDVMMPRMDGFDLCRAIKTDERTSHIPVILLTAKSTVENRIEGYELGADAYISKPFEMGHLKVRIKNLIDNRNKLRQIYGKGLALTPGEVTMPSMDEKFIQNAIQSVEAHIGDSEYNVDVLCEDVGMSRSQVFRKLKAITDFSPVEFIRMLRIKRAAQIITQNSNSISEVAYMVGFSDIDYFRKCFKAQFGVTPSKYSDKS